MRASQNFLISAAVLVAMAGASTDALASLSITPNFITVKATSGSSTVTFSVPVVDDPMDSIDPVDEFVNFPILDTEFTGWDWFSATPFPLVDTGSGNTLLWITDLSLTSGTTLNTITNQRRWGHEMGFSLIAGSADVDIEITTNIMSFDAVFQSAATSDTGFGLTDSADSSVGATATGLLDSGYVFEAAYNSGNVFRNYLDFDPGLFTTTSTGADGNMAPPGSFELVGTDISSMQITYKFRLTAEDQANATGKFVVLPSPGALSLMGLGVVVIARRNRRA